jgi:hypothetical protein
MKEGSSLTNGVGEGRDDLPSAVGASSILLRKLWWERGGGGGRGRESMP